MNSYQFVGKKKEKRKKNFAVNLCPKGKSIKSTSVDENHTQVGNAPSSYLVYSLVKCVDLIILQPNGTLA